MARTSYGNPSQTFHLFQLWGAFLKKPKGSVGKPMNSIKYHELSNAYQMFLKLEGIDVTLDNLKERITKFEKFLDISLGGILNLKQESIEKVKWLNGPHAETMYKAWKVKHE